MRSQLIVSSIAVSAFFAFPAFARQPDHGCYMQTSSGQIVNLSRSVCRFDSGDASASQDAAYLAAIKKMMGEQAEPWMLEMLANNPNSFTTSAREYCQARQSGVSDSQFIDRKYQALLESLSSAANEKDHEQQNREYYAKLMPYSLAASFASEHYCPTVAQRRSIQRAR